MSYVSDAFEIGDAESFEVARELLRKEGILGGSSTGTLLAGALRYCRQQTTKKRVVTFVCDTGNKYLSKMYNDFWMADQGFGQRPPHGDLSDLISHRHEAGEVVSVGPDDTLLTAVKRMRSAGISQVPVVDEKGRAVGILDESDVLVKVHQRAGSFSQRGANGDDRSVGDTFARGEDLGFARGIRPWPRRHCDGGRPISWVDHAKRPPLLSAAAIASSAACGGNPKDQKPNPKEFPNPKFEHALSL